MLKMQNGGSLGVAVFIWLIFRPKHLPLHPQCYRHNVIYIQLFFAANIGFDVGAN